MLLPPSLRLVGAWHITEILQTSSQNNPLLPRPPSAPRKGCKQWIRTTAEGTLWAWWHLQPQHCSCEVRRPGAHSRCAVWGLSLSLSVPNSGMPEKQEHLHYSTRKLISKTVHLNIHQASESQFWLQALLLLTLQLRPETQEHDSDLPKAVLPLSTTAASTGILISTLSILSIWATAAKFKWKYINHTNIP